VVGYSSRTLAGSMFFIFSSPADDDAPGRIGLDSKIQDGALRVDQHNLFGKQITVGVQLAVAIERFDGEPILSIA
jgi:hypothetical protein